MIDFRPVLRNRSKRADGWRDRMRFGEPISIRSVLELMVKQAEFNAQLDLDKHGVQVVADAPDAGQESGASGFASRVRRTRDAVRVQ